VETFHPPQENILQTGHCGTCTRCLTACPTEAILAPTQVDSRRCIAYWTIENVDEQLPELITAHQNGWIFGCDICQEVCPWNIKFSHLTEEPAFAPRPILQRPKRESFASMTEEDFEKHFQNSPLRRKGLKRIKRNLPS
jgi:epoxyqueuosine reductase